MLILSLCLYYDLSAVLQAIARESHKVNCLDYNSDIPEYGEWEYNT